MMAEPPRLLYLVLMIQLGHVYQGRPGIQLLSAHNLKALLLHRVLENRETSDKETRK